MFKRLLVPLDRSPLAEQAIEEAVAIARASHAEVDLTLIHQLFPIDGYIDAPWNAELLADQQRYLESIAEGISSRSSVRVTHAILKGPVVELICSRIEDIHADLVVMTSHGRTGLSRAWLGSVADGVVRHATVPVLMLRPEDGVPQQAAGARLFKHILVPVDGSPLSAEVLPAAAALAKCSGARVFLLRVVQPTPAVVTDFSVPFTSVPAFVDSGMTKRLLEEAREQIADLALRFRRETGVEVETEVVIEDRVAPAILDFARTHGIDVVAMSTQGRGMSRLVVGSIADKVLRGSGLPMLLYRPLGVREKDQSAEMVTAAVVPTLGYA